MANSPVLSLRSACKMTWAYVACVSICLFLPSAFAFGMPALVRGGCGAPLGFCKSSLRIRPAAGAAVLLRQSKEPIYQEGMTDGLVIREAEEPPLSGRGFLNVGSFRFSFSKPLACTLTPVGESRHLLHVHLCFKETFHPLWVLKYPRANRYKMCVRGHCTIV